MKLFLFRISKDRRGKRSAQQNHRGKSEDYLNSLGREQFEKLVKRGLGIPVAIF